MWKGENTKVQNTVAVSLFSCHLPCATGTYQPEYRLRIRAGWWSARQLSDEILSCNEQLQVLRCTVTVTPEANIKWSFLLIVVINALSIAVYVCAYAHAHKYGALDTIHSLESHLFSGFVGSTTAALHRRQVLQSLLIILCIFIVSWFTMLLIIAYTHTLGSYYIQIGSSDETFSFA